MECLREWSFCNVTTSPQFLRSRRVSECVKAEDGNKLIARALTRFRWRLNVAQAARRRRGSPIGKKGQRKANPRYKRKLGQPWSKEDLKQLKALAGRTRRPASSA